LSVVSLKPMKSRLRDRGRDCCHCPIRDRFAASRRRKSRASSRGPHLGPKRSQAMEHGTL